MSIGQVTITYTAKKTVNNTLVPVVIGSSTLVTGTGATKSVAEASIQSQIDAAVGNAQGNLTDLQDASAAFNS